MSHYYTLTGEGCPGICGAFAGTDKGLPERIERYWMPAAGSGCGCPADPPGGLPGTAANLQEERPYLINLQAKVRAVAEGK